MLNLIRVIVVFVASTMFGGGVAWALPCTTWTPQLVLSKTSTHESAAFDFAWTNPVTNCDTFTFDNYALCTVAGPAAPTSTTGAGVQCKKVTTRTYTSAVNHFVHRSNKEFSARIFACQNTSCTQYYGDGTYGSTVSSYTDTETTDSEVWVLEEVGGFNDTSRLILDGNATASGALMYPSGFTDADRLGIWWSTEVSNVENIRHKRAQDSGWQSWNTYSNWTSPDTDVAREPVAASTGLYEKCTHPWIAAMDDGTTQSIRLFVNCGATGATSVYSIDSVDEYGADFDITCTSGGGCAADADTCPYNSLCDWDDVSADGGAAVEEICHDETAGCFYLDNAGHGRLMWEYIANGAVDFATDEPRMLLSGSPESPGCASALAADNLYVASWDISGTPFWDIATSGSCPTDAISASHDPGVIPLPNGEFKAYYRDGMTQYYVAYWDGSGWVDETAIDLAFDDSTYDGSINSTLQTCLENVDALVYINSGTPVEGAFFREVKHDGSNGCFSADGTSGGAFGGIVYAEHRN